jgi:hypothetical protein
LGVVVFAWLVVISLLAKASLAGSEVADDLVRLASIHPNRNTLIAPIAAPIPIPAFAPVDNFLELDAAGTGLEVDDEAALSVEVVVNDVEETGVDEDCKVIDD